ncbi:MAG TPA: dockerin type I domain-containing protein, partial [Saprospiraceae bacterium]|nr:dockerin type I domain-containing protein [Saprospiraceae bacterium]
HVTINCTQDFEDLNITGKPDLYTACNAPKVIYTDLDININDCGIGSLTRRWSVENNPGVGCDQKITIIGIRPVTLDSIVWPSDTTVTCLDILAGQNPIINGGACDQVAFQMEADTFNFVSDACYKILKHWTVIDWCQYELNNPNSSGKWTHTQTIKVIDTLGPVIANCPSDDIIINAQNCTVESFVISATSTDQSCGINQPLRWNYAVDIDNNGSIEFTGTLSGNTVSKTITSPNTSNAKVYWSVTDGCNNVSNCIQYYRVKDTKAPQVYCQNLAISIPVGGDAIIWASDFDKGSTDECTLQNNLRFSFSATSIDSSRIFTCADIPNGVSTNISITIWVYDESGNKASCNATLSLQDNANVCPNVGNLLGNIAGRLATEAGQGLDSASVGIQIGTVEPGFASSLSNEQGNYKHIDNVIDQTYVIKPEHNVDWLNGVSTLDLVLIQRHILDIDQLSSPYTRIAADVNNDGRITAADLVALRKLILGIQVNVVGNESWKFVPKSHTFADPKFPFPYPSTLIIDTLKAHSLANDFIAIKIGDINLNADPSAHSSRTESRSAKTFDLRYKTEQVVEDKNRIKLTFYASEDVNLHGLQMSLNIFGELPKVTEGLLSINDDDIYYNGQEWRIAFANDRAQNITKDKPLFYLEVDKSNWLTLNDRHFKNEVYTNEALDIQHLKLVNISTEVHQAAFVVDQNVPNPFRDQTSISFELPETDEVRFEVKNIKGELIFSNAKVYEKGRNTIEFKRNASLTSGVYYYTVTSTDSSATFKMIILE